MLAIAENEVSGKVVNIGSFVYSIGKEKNIVPIGRLWNYLCEQARRLHYYLTRELAL